MRRRLKQVLALTCVGVVVTAVATWPAALTFITQNRLRALRAQGVPLNWSGLKAEWNALHFDSLSATLPGPKVATGSDLIPMITVPIPLEIQATTIRVVPSSLLSLSPTLAFETLLYGGKLSGEATSLRESPTIRAHLDSVKIDQHPILGGAGIRGGDLSVHTDSLTVVPGKQLPQGSFSVEVKQLNPPEIAELKTFLKVDNVGPLDLSARATTSSETVKIEKVEVTSPLASITGNATLTAATSRNPELRGDFKVRLSDQGIQTLGPWLPLVSGGSIQAGASSFTARLTTKPCSSIQPGQPRVAIGSKCLDLSYSP